MLPSIFILVLVIFVIFVVSGSIKIVRQYEKGLVETLGKFSSLRNPGPNILVPFFQRMIRVDMRERVIDVPPQSVITKDNVSVVVDAIIYFQVTDPVKVVYNIENFALAALKLAQTNLRNVIGDMELDSTLTSREKINSQLRVVMDEATDKWGVKVTRVEIQKIDPPKDITDSMSKQMKAEREKRANILEAEGLRQAAILKAEGAKQAVILEAEATKEKQVLEANGEAQAIKQVADAEKYKIEVVYNAIHEGKPTNDLIAIKYLETLGQVADGKATKVFLPLETTGVTAAIGGIAELFKDPKDSKNIDKVTKPQG
ncbi:MAG: SPFH/Band 7/PHB domain protein [Elusimicrobiota bacterium]|jgi:regulator of protease activity HflC (stomatin/prohibitin superfamily)|nr:SPFH/Band 7/PHB domain protein [Elusimicrobiota bacterium]